MLFINIYVTVGIRMNMTLEILGHLEPVSTFWYIILRNVLLPWKNSFMKQSYKLSKQVILGLLISKIHIHYPSSRWVLIADDTWQQVTIWKRNLKKSHFHRHIWMYHEKRIQIVQTNLRLGKWFLNHPLLIWRKSFWIRTVLHWIRLLNIRFVLFILLYCIDFITYLLNSVIY